MNPWSSLKNIISERIENTIIPPWLLGLVTVLILAFLLAPPTHSPTERLKVGDISPKDIKAPTDLSIEDKTTTLKRQEEAVAHVLAIYDFDPDINKINNKINLLFIQKKKLDFPEHSELQVKPVLAPAKDQTAQKPPTDKSGGNPETTPQKKELSLEERWRLLAHQDILPISFDTYRILDNPLFDQSIKQVAHKLVSTVMTKGIVGNKELLQKEKSVIQRNLKDKSEKVINDIDGFLSMEEAKQLISQLTPNIFVADKFSRQAVIEIAQLAIQPNLFFNKSATEESKKAVLQSVKPVYFQAKKGEMIVREGERVREDQMIKLTALRLLRHKHMPRIFFAGIVFILILLFYLMFKYLNNFRPNLVDNPLRLYLLVMILLVTFTISRFFIFLSSALSAFTPQINITAYSYAIPFALGGMLVTVLVDAQLGVIFSVLVGILAAIQMGGEFGIFLLAAMGGMGAVYGVIRAKQRTVLLKTGLVIGIVNVAVIIPLHFMKGRLFSIELLHDCLGGLANGLLVAIIASAVIPVLEIIFKVTTDIKLLEISDMNQPLLKRLALEAPGTYQHSIVVGSLAEAAAESVGANPLLARIAAYYHDIGKVSKPEYFVENQVNQVNKHDKLSPNMSSLILNSHIKEGLELARQYKLPPLIMEVIQQHHGTSLIQFFYQKAKQQEKAHVQIIKKEDFSYPGPRPQTKESGIIMLSDVLEASSRALSNQTPQKLEELVRRTIHEIYNAGQLDECDLTLKNLNQIATAFIRILTSVFHARIEYPRVETLPKKERQWTSKSEINVQGKK